MASADRMNASIPDDVIPDILSWLSVRDLCRFRCVSKLWSSFISDPGFQQQHLHRRQHNPQLFISTFEKESKSGLPKTNHHFLFDKESENLNLIAKFRLPEQLDLPCHTAFSCLDLVCIYDCHNVYVCNPAMKRCITLSGNSLSGNKEIHTEYVAFGYVASTSTYKVFRVFKPAVRHPIHTRKNFEVLTLGSNKWRAADPAPYNTEIDFQSMTATIDGSSYLSWNYYKPFYQDIMVVFNIKEEKWLRFRVPDGTLATRLCLMEIGGGLCMACLERRSHIFDLWQLKAPRHDKQTWEKKCSIDISMADSSWPLPLTIEQETRKIMLSPMIHRLPCYDVINPKMGKIYNGKSHNTVSFYVESFRSFEIEGFKHVPVRGNLNKHVQIFFKICYLLLNQLLINAFIISSFGQVREQGVQLRRVPWREHTPSLFRPPLRRRDERRVAAIFFWDGPLAIMGCSGWTGGRSIHSPRWGELSFMLSL